MQSPTRLKTDSDHSPGSSQALSRVAWTTLTDEVWERALSFLLAIPLPKGILYLDGRFVNLLKAPGAWQDARVEIPQRLSSVYTDCRDNFVRFVTTTFSRTAEVILPAHPRRRHVQEGLQQALPNVRFTVSAEGPHPLFIMGSGALPIGISSGLHLFEPRYQWMCRRILATEPPHLFAWVTDPSGHGAGLMRGCLCELTQHETYRDGSVDACFVCVAHFDVLEVWQEEVPRHRRAPPLAVGYLGLRAPLQSVAGLRSRGRLVEQAEEEDEEEDDEGDLEDSSDEEDFLEQFLEDIDAEQE